MVFAFFGRVARIRITLAYAVILVGVTTAMVTLGPRAHDRIVAHASTNLHNLSHGHLGTLLGSAFVVDAGPIYGWLPGLVCLLAAAELQWGSARLVLTFGVGHVGATLLVASGLTAAIEQGWLPGSLTRATDVGMSYGAAAVLGSLTAAVPPRWRPGWTGLWLGVAGAVFILGRDFTDIGHAVALLLGMLVSTRFRMPARWTRLSILLACVGVAFGYLVLANAGPPVGIIAAASGLLGVLIAEVVARWWTTKSEIDRDVVDMDDEVVLRAG